MGRRNKDYVSRCEVVNVDFTTLIVSQCTYAKGHNRKDHAFAQVGTLTPEQAQRLIDKEIEESE